MASQNGGGFRLNVLNPGGRDPEQHFDGSAPNESSSHAPVNFHAYAASTGGSFFRDTRCAIAAKSPLLLLLRIDFREGERALAALQKARVPVAVSLKETGQHQIAEQLEDPRRLTRFRRIMEQADACLASTPEAAEFYRTVCRSETPVEFIPTPYPLHDPAWDFSAASEDRSGILLGTRELDIPSRNHVAALMAARRISEATGERVSVFNIDGWSEARLLRSIGFGADRLRLHKESGYRDYLRIAAQHKLIFQLDRSYVPGQVAGDALLTRIPCVGGNGAIERIAFPDLCGEGRTTRDLIALSVRLLQDEEFYREAVAASQERAAEVLSFDVVARQLEEFFGRLRR